MSGIQPNPDFDSGVQLRAPATPRHGRIRSGTIEQAVVPSQQPYIEGPTSSHHGHSQIPTVVYSRHDVPTELQSYSGESIVPFCRWAFAIFGPNDRARPNHNFDLDIDNAIWWSYTIVSYPFLPHYAEPELNYAQDEFDENECLIHELILRIANQDLGHPAMEPIRQNRAMVKVLLYRHFTRHGGVMLPPTAPALQAMDDHQRAVDEARRKHWLATGKELLPDHYPRMRFPKWRDTGEDGQDQETIEGKPQGTPGWITATGGGVSSWE
jgi:hypothetical protein